MPGVRWPHWEGSVARPAACVLHLGRGLGLTIPTRLLSQGGKEYLMRAHFGLPSVEAEDKEGKPPISVKFEIPYFTTSGIQVRARAARPRADGDNRDPQSTQAQRTASDTRITAAQKGLPSGCHSSAPPRAARPPRKEACTCLLGPALCSAPRPGVHLVPRTGVGASSVQTCPVGPIFLGTSMGNL